ncbi:MAG TPA: hypothetical protein VGM93_03865 [Acidimicrobiales bacterium]
MPALTVLALVLAFALVTAGCTSHGGTGHARPRSSGPRPLTAGEADGLALMRSMNERAGTRSITIRLPGRPGLVIRGWVDFAHHVGYGTVSPGSADAAADELISWNLQVVGLQPWHRTTAPLPMPRQGWQAAPLSPTTSVRDDVLAVVLNLAASRPDNADLLRQSDARWLRRAHVGSSPVDVVAGPSSDAPGTRDDAATRNRRGNVRYWVAAGGELRRVQIRDGSTGLWSQADLGPSSAVRLVASR